MLDLIKKIIGEKGDDESKNNDKILDAHIAMCVLLLEAAHADGECSDEEMDNVISILSRETATPRRELDELISSSYSQREKSVDLFRFTRYLNQNFSKVEKIEVMQAVWRIILIDDQLEAHEDHFAHKLANLLRLTHRELIDAKVVARKKLGQ